MTDQPTSQEVVAAKAEIEQQIQEIQESLLVTVDLLNKQNAIIAAFSPGLARKEAMKNREVLSAERRRCEQALAQKTSSLSGMDDLFQEALSREAAERSKAARMGEIASRRERAELFDLVSAKIESLDKTMRNIFDVGQDPKFIPQVLAGQAGDLAERFRNLARQERREAERQKSKLES